MRLPYLFLLGLFWAHRALADVVQVPLLPDDTVDFDKVYQGFHLEFPIFENNADSTEFTGTILGEVFSGQLSLGETLEEFFLAINAPTLSEHGNFLIAVLATQIICLRNDRAPGGVLWQDTAKHNGVIWDVSSSCSTSTD